MSRSILLSFIYFALALLGLLWSWSHFIQFFRTTDGLALQLFFGAVMQNEASAGVAIDATLAGVVFSVMAVTRASRDGVKWPWLYVVATFAIGIAVAMPVYLGFRERVLAASKE